MKRIHEDKRYNKKSINALMVAKEYKEAILNGKKINKVELAVRNGYSKKSALAQKPYRTLTFKRALANTVDVLNEVRAKSLESLLKKDLDKEKYRDLVEGVDKLTKNSRLLEGKSTDNIANNIVVFGDDDFLSQQVKKQ